MAGASHPPSNAYRQLSTLLTGLEPGGGDGERARALRHNASREGQEAGVPGMGAPPILVHEPGLSVLKDMLHPVWTPFELLRRIQPKDGWFSPAVNPQHPVQFQLGSFGVPQNQLALVMDYEFAVYRPSGIDPGDFVRAENGRFSNQLGFDISVDGVRIGNTSFQLVPQPAPIARQSFEPPTIFPFDGSGPAQNEAFVRARANSFAAVAGSGTATLPLRPNVLGPRGGPFTIVADQSSQVALGCVIFNRLRSPISCVEGRVAGYLIETQVATSILNRVRPK